MKYLIFLLLTLSVRGQFVQNIVNPAGLPALNISQIGNSYEFQLNFPAFPASMVPVPYADCSGVVWSFIDFEDPGLTEYYVNIPLYNLFYPFTLQQPWIDGDIINSPLVLPAPTVPYNTTTTPSILMVVSPVGIGVVEFSFTNSDFVLAGGNFQPMTVVVSKFPTDPLLAGVFVEIHSIMNITSNYIGSGNVFITDRVSL